MKALAPLPSQHLGCERAPCGAKSCAPSWQGASAGQGRQELPNALESFKMTDKLGYVS